MCHLQGKVFFWLFFFYRGLGLVYHRPQPDERICHTAVTARPKGGKFSTSVIRFMNLRLYSACQIG